MAIRDERGKPKSEAPHAPVFCSKTPRLVGIPGQLGATAGVKDGAVNPRFSPELNPARNCQTCLHKQAGKACETCSAE